MARAIFRHDLGYLPLLVNPRSRPGDNAAAHHWLNRQRVSIHAAQGRLYTQIRSRQRLSGKVLTTGVFHCFTKTKYTYIGIQQNKKKLNDRRQFCYYAVMHGVVHKLSNAKMTHLSQSHLIITLFSTGRNPII